MYFMKLHKIKLMVSIKYSLYNSEGPMCVCNFRTNLELELLQRNNNLATALPPSRKHCFCMYTTDQWIYLGVYSLQKSDVLLLEKY